MTAPSGCVPRPPSWQGRRPSQTTNPASRLVPANIDSRNRSSRSPPSPWPSRRTPRRPPARRGSETGGGVSIRAVTWMSSPRAPSDCCHRRSLRVLSPRRLGRAAAPERIRPAPRKGTCCPLRPVNRRKASFRSRPYRPSVRTGKRRLGCGGQARGRSGLPWRDHLNCHGVRSDIDQRGMAKRSPQRYAAQHWPSLRSGVRSRHVRRRGFPLGIAAAGS
jgi:hypothetical protein